MPQPFLSWREKVVAFFPKMSQFFETIWLSASRLGSNLVVKIDLFRSEFCMPVNVNLMNKQSQNKAFLGPQFVFEVCMGGEKKTSVLLSWEYEQRPERVIQPSASSGKKQAELKTEEGDKNGNRRDGVWGKATCPLSLFLLSQVMCFILMVEVMCQVRES